MNTTISFNPDGTALCLWTEAVPLHELGRLEINRATNIEFNNTTQHWEVRDLKGKVRYFARSRCTCLEWERENLQPESPNLWHPTEQAHPHALPRLEQNTSP